MNMCNTIVFPGEICKASIPVTVCNYYIPIPASLELSRVKVSRLSLISLSKAAGKGSKLIWSLLKQWGRNLFDEFSFLFRYFWHHSHCEIVLLQTAWQKWKYVHHTQSLRAGQGIASQTFSLVFGYTTEVIA
jgi:hypothetical protein